MTRRPTRRPRTTLPQRCRDCHAPFGENRRQRLRHNQTPFTHWRCEACENRWLLYPDPARLERTRQLVERLRARADEKADAKAHQALANIRRPEPFGGQTLYEFRPPKDE